MKKSLLIAWDILQILIVIYVVLVVLFMSISNGYGYGEINKYVIDVDNNEFLIIKKTDRIKEGDLIYYYSIVKDRYKIVYSNITAINDEESTCILDNGEEILTNRIVGKTYRKVPVIGFILNMLRYKINFILFVILPILIVFIYQVYKFIVGMNYKRIEE